MPETIITKQCSGCKKPKGLDDFPRYKLGKLGRHNQCKVCRREANQRYIHSDRGKAKRKALAQSPKAKQAMRQYLDTPHGRILHAKHGKQWMQTDKGKAYRKEADKRRAEKHPKKVKARLAISHEIAQGRMQSAKTQFCAHCGNKAEYWHHHRGYEAEHRLDVIALCRHCDFGAHNLSSIIVDTCT